MIIKWFVAIKSSANNQKQIIYRNVSTREINVFFFYDFSVTHDRKIFEKNQGHVFSYNIINL